MTNSSAAKIGQPRSLRLVAGWLLLLGFLGFLLAIRSCIEPWLWMWFVACTLFFGFKLLTLLRLDASEFDKFSPGALIGYLFLWPGLRPQPFINLPGSRTFSSRYLWLNGCVQLGVGCIIIWGIPSWLAVQSPTWLRAWLGMVGFSLAVHFGFFDLLGAFWRSRGVPVEKLFSNPWWSVSLTDFWSNRWNRAFSGFARDLVFWPLARRWGARGATLAVFIFSGLVHELMISFPAHGGYGGPFFYFLINGIAVCLEGSQVWQNLVTNVPGFGRFWVLTAVLVPLSLLFHQPFQLRVVVPFLNALGASAMS